MKLITGIDSEPTGEIKSSKSNLFIHITLGCLIRWDQTQSKERFDEEIYFLSLKTLMQNMNDVTQLNLFVGSSPVTQLES